ncbi:MAG: hypothetical protein ABIH11_03250 [Candidatus Altiarchaeota archaeon]
MKDNRIILFMLIPIVFSLFAMSYVRVSRPSVTGGAITVCSSGNTCDGKNPGDSYICDKRMEEDLEGSFNCECNEYCQPEIGLVCSKGSECEGRSPGSVFRCDDGMKYDQNGGNYCSCSIRCESHLI